MKNVLIAASVALHLVLPASMLAWTPLARHANRARFLSAAALTGACLLCLGLVGAAWPRFGLSAIPQVLAAHRYDGTTRADGLYPDDLTAYAI